MNDMCDIWCEHKESKPKFCQHMYIKGQKANTLCTVKIKGEGNYCSRHGKSRN